MSDVDARESHWDEVYRTKHEGEVSWFEEVPLLSLELMAANSGRTDAIIDIGGGASRLLDALLARDYSDVTVLDISAEALAKARDRVEKQGGKAEWIVADITKWCPGRSYDLWHDRAAFHFLTDPTDQAAYASVLAGALRPGGTAIIATFAPDGPEKCSGLPVMRHDAHSIAAILGRGFQLQQELRHDHRTPWGSVQRFQFSVFRRLAQ
jgi:trans-aconitate methyltransferase